MEYVLSYENDQPCIRLDGRLVPLKEVVAAANRAIQKPISPPEGTTWQGLLNDAHENTTQNAATRLDWSGNSQRLLSYEPIYDLLHEVDTPNDVKFVLSARPTQEYIRQLLNHVVENPLISQPHLVWRGITFVQDATLPNDSLSVQSYDAQTRTWKTATLTGFTLDN